MELKRSTKARVTATSASGIQKLAVILVSYERNQVVIKQISLWAGYKLWTVTAIPPE